MDDLISRQAAIDAIEFGITYARAFNKETGEVKELFQEGNSELRKAVERVKDLPSAERKRGEWMVEDIYGSVSCSVCGCALEDWIQGAFYNFCPYCGADMRGEKEDG